MSERNAVEILSDLAVEFYENRCALTGEKFKPKGFVLHHLWYYIKDDVERKNYPAGPKGRDAYMRDLEPLVRAEPWRFLLTKNGMHTRLDHIRRGLTRLKKETLIRLFLAAYLAEKKRR